MFCKELTSEVLLSNFQIFISKVKKSRKLVSKTPDVELRFDAIFQLHL